MFHTPIFWCWKPKDKHWQTEKFSVCIKIKSSPQRSFKCSRIKHRHISLVGQELLKGNCGVFYAPGHVALPAPWWSSNCILPCAQRLMALCRVLAGEGGPETSLLAQQCRLGLEPSTAAASFSARWTQVSVLHPTVIQRQLKAVLRLLQRCQMAEETFLQPLQLLGEGRGWPWGWNHFFHMTDASRHQCNTVLLSVAWN